MLHYDLIGEGPPIVLLHAGIVDSRIWQTTAPLLATEHTVLAYDQRGYGRSQRPDGPYSLIDDLAWVLDDAGFARAALVGLSRGGRIAIDFALTYPERVTALVPVAAALSGHQLRLDVPEEIERGWEEAEARGDLEALGDLDLAIWAPLGVDPALRAMTVENAEWSNGDDPGTWADPPAAGRLGELRTPTLVITAAEDVPGINEVGEILEREIAGARSAVIADADHVVPWRKPEELAKLVLDFLCR